MIPFPLPVLKTPNFLSFKLVFIPTEKSKQPTPRMAKHYVCRTTDLPTHARSEAEKLCGSGRGITPAWVEQCSAESDDFDGLVKQLKVGPDTKWGWRCWKCFVVVFFGCYGVGCWWCFGSRETSGESVFLWGVQWVFGPCQSWRTVLCNLP